MRKGFIIAIDGPLASGKGTIAKKLAAMLPGVDLYTGAMYRCLALFCINSEINLEHAPSVIEQLAKVSIAYRDNRIYLNDTDVTDAIAEAAIAEGASVVAVIPQVRSEFVKRQQKIGNDAITHGKIVVVEGRDIGTVVFPDASMKIYLTASVQVRAKRRFTQYQQQKSAPTFDEVVEQIRIRDTRDTKREASPMTHDPEKNGYWVLDNSEMNEKQTLDAIVSELRRRDLLHD